jgi:hypothetical protein
MSIVIVCYMCALLFLIGLASFLRVHMVSMGPGPGSQAGRASGSVGSVGPVGQVDRASRADRRVGRSGGSRGGRTGGLGYSQILYISIGPHQQGLEQVH